MKNKIKKLVNLLVVLTSKFSIGQYFLEQISKRTMNNTKLIIHNGINLLFCVPNSMNHFRIDTFSTKEPETLEWLDTLPKESILWDIGANVGLYSCYAARARNCTVFSFEPSVFNLELLARNIFLNNLVSQVTIVPLALSDANTINTLRMTTTEWGGALSTFGQNYGHDGKDLIKIFEFQTIGLSMTDALTFFKIPQPDYIKMDVDGIEHLILKGGEKILKSVKGILVEINEEFEDQVVNTQRYLREAGLTLKEKRHGSICNDTICFNQIWARN